MTTSSKATPTSSSSKSNITVHVLSLTSICDAHVRLSTGGSLLPKTTKTIGILVGFAKPRGDGDNGGGKSESGGEMTYTLMDTLEATFIEDSNGKPTSKLDLNALNEKVRLYKGVYSEQALLGWYYVTDNSAKSSSMDHQTLSSDGDEQDLYNITTHNEIQSICNVPALFLHLNSSTHHSQKKHFLSKLLLHHPHRSR